MDTRLLHPWDFLGKSTGVGCHFLLQGIFPTQGSNPGLLHCRQTLYRLSHQGRLYLINISFFPHYCISCTWITIVSIFLPILSLEFNLVLHLASYLIFLHSFNTYPLYLYYKLIYINSSSVQSNHSVMSYSLRPHEPQHTRPPCPSPTPGVHPNSCPLSWWCHPTISSSVIPFSSCPQFLPASVSFQISQLFASGGQSTGVSASTLALPMNTQDWPPLGWTGWISLQSKGLSRVFSNTTVQMHQFFGAQPFSQSNSHSHTWLLGKSIALTRQQSNVSAFEYAI